MKDHKPCPNCKDLDKAPVTCELCKGTKMAPLKIESPPASCLWINPVSRQIIGIKAGVTGFFATTYDNPVANGYDKEWIDMMNARINITPQQSEAMYFCSTGHPSGADAWAMYSFWLDRFNTVAAR